MIEYTLKMLKTDIPNTQFNTVVELHNGYELGFTSFSVYLRDTKHQYTRKEVSRNEVAQLETLCLSIWANPDGIIGKELYLLLCREIDNLFNTHFVTEINETS